MSNILSEPIPVTSTNLRPFTNNDVTNDISYKHGLPRPMKHYRLGIINAIDINLDSPDAAYLKTNIDRYVRSSRSTPLLSLTMERPGSTFTSTSNVNLASDLSKDTRMDGKLNDCCQATNALKRVRGANTNLSKNYYQTSQQYRHARCNTIQQKGYQFSNGGNGKYVGNCSANKQSCNEVVYKPNNTQFATQGAVSSSSRTSRLTLNTVRTEVNDYKNKATADNYVNAGGSTVTPFILKAKTQGVSDCKPSKVCFQRGPGGPGPGGRGPGGRGPGGRGPGGRGPP